MMLLCEGLDSSAKETYEHLNDGQLDVLRVMQSISPGEGLSEHIKGYAPNHMVNMPDGDRDGMGLEVEHKCRVVDNNM